MTLMYELLIAKYLSSRDTFLKSNTFTKINTDLAFSEPAKESFSFLITVDADDSSIWLARYRHRRLKSVKRQL